MKKIIPNCISIIRLISSLLLIIIEPFSIAFIIIYIICGISDVLDGYLARKFRCISKLGQRLDSIADFTFFIIIFYILLINYQFDIFIYIIIIIIFIIKLCSLFIAYIKYKKLGFLHTILNKISGLLLFVFPIFYYYINENYLIIILSIITMMTSIEEILINIFSKELNCDIKTIFHIKKL